MIKLLCVVELDEATTEAEAQAQLDAFREAVRPSDAYGVTIYQATADDLREVPDLHVVEDTPVPEYDHTGRVVGGTEP